MLDYSLSLDILIISKFLIPAYIYKNACDLTQFGSLILSFDSLKYSEWCLSGAEGMLEMCLSV